jgi:DNA-binding NarL/FixJ family response regulator
MPTQISVLISEPTKMHCDLLRQAFYSVLPRFQVVACASSTVDVLTALHEHPPQVAIISSDLQDGPQTGIRILPEIRRTYPETRILVLTGSPDRELVTHAFRSGAVGVFNRNGPFDLLCKAVEVVSQGQIWASTEQLHDVLHALAKSPKQPKLDPKVESRVTKREAAVVRLAVEGLTNREIAVQLTLTEHTVKNYLFRVFDKLGVSNRVELLLYCLRQEEEARAETNEEEKMALGPRKVATVAKRVAVGQRENHLPEPRK